MHTKYNGESCALVFLSFVKLSTIKQCFSQDINKNLLLSLFITIFIIMLFVSDEGITKAFTCARVLVGQYVFLQLVGVEGSLSLCEVEIFSTDGK